MQFSNQFDYYEYPQFEEAESFWIRESYSLFLHESETRQIETVKKNTVHMDQIELHVYRK